MIMMPCLSQNHECQTKRSEAWLMDELETDWDEEYGRTTQSVKWKVGTILLNCQLAIGRNGGKP